MIYIFASLLKVVARFHLYRIYGDLLSKKSPSVPGTFESQNDFHIFRFLLTYRLVGPIFSLLAKVPRGVFQFGAFKATLENMFF